MNDVAHCDLDRRMEEPRRTVGADHGGLPSLETLSPQSPDLSRPAARAATKGVAGGGGGPSHYSVLASLLLKRRDGRAGFREDQPLGVGSSVCRPLVPRNGTQMCNYTRERAVRGTIILAEDDRAIRISLAAALGNIGYQVLATADGDKAVEAALNHVGSIDALIVDVVLPKRMGITVARDIELLHPGICTVFMSGYPREVALQSELIGDSCLFADKPVRAAELDALICAVRYPVASR